ncbi:MAG: polysaccharide biosynthesis protein [Parvularcula sp.]|jgi:O-antigen biosynthesis protein WbqV|nr:polysaccharide biosynthesis protein [Parvularcula sp.]
MFRNLFPKKTQAPEPQNLFDTTGIDLDCESLLGRTPRAVNLSTTAEMMRGRTVLVTGAGGTIGSELCRQIAQFAPERLILADNGEFNLYTIDRELTEAGFGEMLVPQLVDVCQRDHLMNLFRRYRPNVVLHAAALKHVPIVEINPCAAATVNVSGAKNVFDAAIEFAADTVVFISTDKAVNPSSFMGATKRLAELYAQALDVAQNDTRFVTVRFGNVLGSTGSVAPLFQRQIARGGPVTVTHPDVQRYFMTTQEATKLVLKAATLHRDASVLSHDGRIFVLDMGEPIKIVDLAAKMIEAAGLKVKDDIDIVFTKLRPGEKLFEEIFHSMEKLLQTGTDGVLLASPTMIDLPLLVPRLSDVIRHARVGNADALLEAVHALVPEFKPGSGCNPSDIPTSQVRHAV